MDHGIELQVVWFDEDLTELQVRATNGRFAGCVLLYCAHEEIRQQADILEGFPVTIEDSRALELGSFDPEFAGGGMRLLFRCRDRAGHVAVDVQLRSDRFESGTVLELANFALDVEPAAIDRFVKQLRSVEPSVGAEARLLGTP